jgi:hypothetical protein
MRSAQNVGRIVGVMLFMQLAALMLGFILVLPITTSTFLEGAAGVSAQIRAAVLCLFAGGAITIGIAIVGFPVFREHADRMALWLVAFSIIWFAMQAVDNIHILSMLSLSQQYTQGGASNAELFGALATAVRSTRRWAHYTELLVMDSWFLVFYGLLFRSWLVPRALAGFALVMVLVHAAAIPLPMFIGHSSVLVLAYSLPLAYLAVGTRLVVKGFGDPFTHRSRWTELSEYPPKV